MTKHLIALLFTEPRKWEKIFGTSVIWRAKKNLDQTISQVFQKILNRHQLLSTVKSPQFGVWTTAFAIEDDLITDHQEQINSLTETGIKLIKEELKKEFGAATGSRIDFKLVVNPLRKEEDLENLTYLKNLAQDFPVAQLKYKDLVSEGEFNQIIADRKLNTYLQPLVSLPKEENIGYEILTRGPEGDLFSAANLFGAANYFGLKEELELAAVQQGLEWGEFISPPKKISINISPYLLLDNRLYDLLYDPQFEGLLPRVILELTEHLPIEMINQIQKQIIELRQAGVELALDDIGCGYFDLKTVESLEPEIVKLCITVVNKLDQGDKDIEKDFLKIVNQIKGRSSKVLGEGVERAQQNQLLKEFNVDLAQGYYYSRPTPAGLVLNN